MMEDNIADFFEVLFLIASDACAHYGIAPVWVPELYFLVDERGYWIMME